MPAPTKSTPSPVATTAAPPAAGTEHELAPARPGAHHRSGRWIAHWDPEDVTLWEGGGRQVARRNLWLSVFAEFLGFAVWALWSIVVPQLNNAGFALTVDQMFWLVSVPALVGATLRIPYTLAVPTFGGRNWTIVSALVLLVPTTALAAVVQRPDTSFGALLLVAALAGFGGGNFASSMANISFFYPEREKGRALGFNAAGGNIGTAAVQLAVPLVIVAGSGIALERAGLMFLPLCVLAAVLAWRFMDNLEGTRADHRQFVAAAGRRQTWIISVVYIGTFGSFIGYSGAFPTLLQNQFPEVTLSVAFLGALVGSVARPVGGALADRLGGARVTVVSFAAMSLGVVGAVIGLRENSFWLFLGSFLLLFVFTGVGNGSVYRMIPAAFRARADADGGPERARKLAAGCIGIAGAVGAYGGFLIPRTFAWSTNETGSIVPALWAFVGVYAVLGALTWAVYLRKRAALSAVGI